MVVRGAGAASLHASWSARRTCGPPMPATPSAVSFPSLVVVAGDEAEVASVLSAATRARTRGRRSRWRHQDRLGFAAGAVRRRALDRPDRGDRRPRAGGPRLRRPRGNDARQPPGDASPRARGFRQRLMLDPPHGDGATIGGVVATAASGPLRTRFGTPRDLVIGASFVLSDGTVGRSGGKVVKNVAGFDVAKLLVGSLGTLAVDHRGGLPPPSAAGGVAHRRPRVAVGDRSLRLRDPDRTAPGDARASSTSTGRRASSLVRFDSSELGRHGPGRARRP